MTPPILATRELSHPLTISLLLSSSIIVTISRFLQITPSPNEHWFAGILVRVALDPYSQSMIAFFLALVFYSVFQVFGADVDEKHLNGIQAHPFLRFLSGRADVFPMPGGKRSLNHEIQIEQLSLNLAPLQFGIWVMPLLGFIGTVLGISNSIGGLEQMLPSGEGGGARAGDSIRTVLTGLRFKFNTTFVGLCLVVPLMLCLISVRTVGRRNLLLSMSVDIENSAGST